MAAENADGGPKDTLIEVGTHVDSASTSPPQAAVAVKKEEGEAPTQASDDDVVILRERQESEGTDAARAKPFDGGAKEACCFCREQFSIEDKEMVNKGNAKYPRWRCEACHAACTRLEHAFNETAEGKKEMLQLKKNIGLWSLHVVRAKTNHIKNATQRNEHRKN